jgi:hypothetical protein
MTIFHSKHRSESGIARFPIILCVIVLVLAGFATKLATVIGGLVMATVATLFFVPVIYSLMRTRSLHTSPEEDWELLQ